MTIVFILSVICVLVYSGILLWHFLHKKEIDGFFIVSFMYDVVYGILPALLSWEVLFDGSQSDYVKRILDLSSEGILALIYYYLYALLCFIAVTLAYYGKIKQHQLDDQRPFSEKNKYPDSLLPTVAWICLAIGICSLYLWSKAHGSIFTLMLKANSVRSGYGGVTNSFAFFKHPAKVVMLCTMLFLALILKGNPTNKITMRSISNFVGFILSSICSYLYLIANDGRLTIMIFLLAIFWMFIAGKKIKHASRAILVGGVVVALGLLLLLQMDNITRYIRTGVWISENSGKKVTELIIRELGFLPQGGQTSILSAWNGKVGLTALDDLITGVFAWIPTKFKPSGFEDVWNTNTILIYGDLSVLHGQAPCSIVTQAYYDLRFAGIILFGILLGNFARKVDDWKPSEDAMVKYAVKANIMEMLFRAVPYFSMFDIVLGFFPLLVVVVIYRAVAIVKHTIQRG